MTAFKRDKDKERYLGMQRAMIQRGIDAFGSASALAEAAGMKRQLIFKYLMTNMEMRYSTYIGLNRLITAKARKKRRIMQL